MNQVTTPTTSSGLYPLDTLILSHLKPFLILMGIFLVFYFGGLSHFTLGIDDEYGAFRIEPLIWVEQGRWTLYTLERWIITQPTLAFFPLFFFGLFSSLGYLLLTSAYRMDLRDARTYLLFCVFCAFPTIFYIANFLPNVIGLAVGLFAACLAIYCFSRLVSAGTINPDTPRAKVLLFLVATVAVAISTGAYQSLVLVAAIGCVGLVARAFAADDRTSYKSLFIMHGTLVLVLGGGILISEVISHVLRSSVGLEASYMPDWYSDRYLQPEKLLRDPLGVIGAAFGQLTEVYGGSAEVYGYVYYTFPALLILGFLGLIFSARKLTLIQRAGFVIYGIGMLFAPFLLNLVTGGRLPYRALMAVPIAFWLFTMFAVYSRIRYIRIIALVILPVVILQSLYTFSMLQTTRRITLQHDVQVASQLFDRIATTVPGFDPSQIYPIEFFGPYGFETIYPKVRGSTFSGSFFAWDKGNPNRILAFMRILGYSNFRTASGDLRQGIALDMASMPVWPQEGSVVYTDGVIRVRLGKEPSRVQRELMYSAAEQIEVPAFWRFDPETSKFRIINADLREGSGPPLMISGGSDVQMILYTERPEKLRRCILLRIKVEMFAEQDDVAQLFFSPSNTKTFDEVHSERAGISGHSKIDFLLASPNGFQDRFRLDPVMKSQEVQISDITLHCLHYSAG